MANYCKACGQKLGMFTGCVYVSDGVICTPCWKKAGLSTSGDSLISAKNRYNGSMVKSLIEEREVKQELLNKYRETKTYGQLRLDENNKVFKVYDVATELGIYRYEQIVNFELLENDGVVRSGGLTNAVIGGALFGGIGAIAGAAATSSQTNCNSLKIKITLNNSAEPAVFLTFIRTATSKSSSTYNNLLTKAQEVLSVLENIYDSINPKVVENVAQPTGDNFSKIRELKSLLDDGIITQEEFDAKKKELLGL